MDKFLYNSHLFENSGIMYIYIENTDILIRFDYILYIITWTTELTSVITVKEQDV